MEEPTFDKVGPLNSGLAASNLSCNSSEGCGNASSGSNCSSASGRKSLNSPVCSIQNRISLAKLSEERKAKRCRFYRNGDQWFPGFIVAVGGERHRTWDSLLEELTRVLNHPQHLTAGVRHIFGLNGEKVTRLDKLAEGCEYVASSTELLKQIDYQKAKLPHWRIYARRKEALHVRSSISPSQSLYYSGVPTEKLNDIYLKPKLITVIRNGIRPRKVARILLNRKTARSFEQILNNITEAIKLDSGAVRKVFNINGTQVLTIQDFFQNEDLFVAYGVERFYQDDFYLDTEEYKSIQPLMRGPVMQRQRRVGSPQPGRRSISPMGMYDGTNSLPRSARKDRHRSPHKKLRHPDAGNGHIPKIMQGVFPVDLEEKYSINHILGDGNFAVVKHCVNRVTQQEFALKIIDKDKCLGDERMIESEVSILRRMCHPNIVGLIEEYQTRKNLYLVMELVKGGDLFDAIYRSTKYTEYDASCMISNLISAVKYLHDMNIVHRDIKPENLLVEETADRTIIKLGDFGLACEVVERLYTVCGTPVYVAPEIIGEIGYGLKVDIWAAGVITYIILCGFPPFVSADGHQEELFERIMRGEYEFYSPYWDHVSETAKDLIVHMIEVNEEKRYTAAQVLDHPWLSLSVASNYTRNSTSSGGLEEQNSITNNNI